MAYASSRSAWSGYLLYFVCGDFCFTENRAARCSAWLKWAAVRSAAVYLSRYYHRACYPTFPTFLCLPRRDSGNTGLQYVAYALLCPRAYAAAGDGLCGQCHFLVRHGSHALSAVARTRAADEPSLKVMLAGKGLSPNKKGAH